MHDPQESPVALRDLREGVHQRRVAGVGHEGERVSQDTIDPGRFDSVLRNDDFGPVDPLAGAEELPALTSGA